MKSLFDPSENRNIIERITNLTPEPAALWGKIDVAQMLNHAQISLKSAFGELISVFWIFNSGRMGNYPLETCRASSEAVRSNK